MWFWNGRATSRWLLTLRPVNDRSDQTQAHQPTG
jgi:hypothetical protein